MKILILGDIHEDIEKAKRIIDSNESDFVLQTGDFGAYCNFSKPVYFIAGNHENWKIIKDIDNEEVKFENLYHLKTGEIIKLIKNKEMLSLSGINGNYSPKSYGMKIPNKERHFTKYDVEKCKKLKDIDIFLSHEPPAGIDFIKRNKDVGVEPIEEILNAIKPKFLFFCHHHTFFEKEIDATKIFGLDYARNGYCILDTNKNDLIKVSLNNNKIIAKDF